MKKGILLVLVAIFALSLAVPIPSAAARSSSWVHGIVINVDGTDYYLAGAPDGPGGAFDIPGHAWKMISETRLIGKHYNTGPFGAPSWWSSDAPDGALLYIVSAKIDTWTPWKARMYARWGYVHYHELIRVCDGALHPTKVVWLKHFAVRSFTLDGGPRPDLAHSVQRWRVDYQFIPNGMMPYSPV